MARTRPTGKDHRRKIAALKRDTTLARLSSITAGIAIGTVAAVGVLGVYVAKAFPGHHAPTSTSTGSSSTGNQAPASVGNSGNSGNSGSGLSPASSPPQASSTPAPVTSGSS